MHILLYALVLRDFSLGKTRAPANLWLAGREGITATIRRASNMKKGNDEMPVTALLRLAVLSSPRVRQKALPKAAQIQRLPRRIQTRAIVRGVNPERCQEVKKEGGGEKRFQKESGISSCNRREGGGEPKKVRKLGGQKRKRQAGGKKALDSCPSQTSRMKSRAVTRRDWKKRRAVCEKRGNRRASVETDQGKRHQQKFRARNNT